METCFNFTVRKLDNLPSPTTSQKRYRDAKEDGLIIRVTTKGKKVFYFYKWAFKKPYQLRIGEYPYISIDHARNITKQWKADITRGIDPKAAKIERQNRELSIQDVLEDYIADMELKESTIKDYRRSIKWGLNSWVNYSLLDITKPMIVERHKELGKKSKARANNTMRVLRAIYNYSESKYLKANGESIVTQNPVKILSDMRRWYRIDRKTSVIKAHEIKSWLSCVKALSSKKYPKLAQTASTYFQFLLFTGLRPGEASTLLWEHVDFKDKSFKLFDTKNGLSPEFPLTTYTHDLLKERAKSSKSKYVFPSNQTEVDKPLIDFRDWVEKIRTESGIFFNPHDLRRTFLTIAESLEISPTTIKRLANHISGEHDVTTGYIVRDIERLRQPAQLITEKILGLFND